MNKGVLEQILETIKTHDFNIRKNSEHVLKHVEVLADSGYQGIAKLHTNSIVPYKRPKGVNGRTKNS